MKEYPLILIQEMVPPTLDGRKTQTRRFADDPRYKNVKVGDRFWGRESFKVSPFNSLVYRADKANTRKAKVDRAFGPWSPSIHMPRWASRIILEVTAVRVERLQKITSEDCYAEGIERTRIDEKYHDEYHVDERGEFRRLWDSLYPSRGWDTNPEVRVFEFVRRVK